MRHSDPHAQMVPAAHQSDSLGQMLLTAHQGASIPLRSETLHPAEKQPPVQVLVPEDAAPEAPQGGRTC